MAYNSIDKRFRVQVLLRLLRFSLCLGLCLFLVFRTQFISVTLFVALLCLFEAWKLIRFVERTHEMLERFFAGISYDDFSHVSLPGSQEDELPQLNRSLYEITDRFQQIRAEKEESLRFLEQVIQQVEVAMLSLSENGEIRFANQAARRLFDQSLLSQRNELPPEVIALLPNITQGNQYTLHLQRERENLQLMVQGSDFRLGNTRYQLLSFQNIGQELEKQESLAWQKLIRVLTHEIMNSVTPLNTLADTLRAMLFASDGKTYKGQQLDTEQEQDVRLSIDLIRRRSEALLNFVSSYRNLSQIPAPHKTRFQVLPLLQELQKLFQTQVEKESINLSILVSPNDLGIYADRELLEQVLINLIINGIEALQGRENAQLTLLAAPAPNQKGKTQITVKDNGPGLSAEEQAKVFIPFYSSKKEGSGIGLSISRQIMQKMEGSLQVQSTPATGASFIINC